MFSNTPEQLLEKFSADATLNYVRNICGRRERNMWSEIVETD